MSIKLQLDSPEFDTSDFDVCVYPMGSDIKGNWRELWEYRDLIFLLVRRDFISRYKQTVLGPAWAVIQPLFSTMISAFVFGNLAGLSPNSVPSFLFYFIGNNLWNLFSTALTNTSSTFSSNSGLMGKVYFPRFAVPIASVLTRLIDFGIQILLYIFFYFYFVFRGAPIIPNANLALVPLYLVHLLILALGVGALLSSFTTKYRDVGILISFGLTLWMYVTPVLYEITSIPAKFLPLYCLNPVTPVVVHIRNALLGQATYCWPYYWLSLVVSLVLLFVGYKVFCRAERTFVDTI